MLAVQLFHSLPSPLAPPKPKRRTIVVRPLCAAICPDPAVDRAPMRATQNTIITGSALLKSTSVES